MASRPGAFAREAVALPHRRWRRRRDENHQCRGWRRCRPRRVAPRHREWRPRPSSIRLRPRPSSHSCGPQLAHAIVSAWCRRSPAAAYSAAHASQRANSAIVVRSRSNGSASTIVYLGPQFVQVMNGYAKRRFVSSNSSRSHSAHVARSTLTLRLPEASALGTMRKSREPVGTAVTTATSSITDTLGAPGVQLALKRRELVVAAFHVDLDGAGAVAHPPRKRMAHRDAMHEWAEADSLYDARHSEHPRGDRRRGAHVGWAAGRTMARRYPNHSSRPSPVRPEPRMISSSRIHGQCVGDGAVDVEGHVREQVGLGHHDARGVLEHLRILERLVLALGDGEEHDHFLLAEIPVCRAHQVADVFDDEQPRSPQVDGVERREHLQRIEVARASGDHGADEPRGVLREAIRVVLRLHVARDHRDVQLLAERREGALEQRRLPGARRRDEVDRRDVVRRQQRPHLGRDLVVARHDALANLNRPDGHHRSPDRPRGARRPHSGRCAASRRQMVASRRPPRGRTRDSPARLRRRRPRPPPP